MAGASGRSPRPLATLLVATDFSPGARHAARRALLLPAAPEQVIHLLHVIGPPAPGARAEASRAASSRRLEVEAAWMRRRARALGRTVPEVVTAIASGAPHVQIIRRARLVGADLVLLGRHARRSLRDLVPGTTAARVVRLGDTPVVVVNGRPGGPYRRLLVAVGLEDTSAPLVTLAARLAAPDAAPMLLVHACWAPAMTRLISTAGPTRERARDRRFDGRLAATQMRALLVALEERHPGLALRPRILHGDPRRLLPSQALRTGAELVALGTHGRAGVAHVLLGSVAERVIMASPCDALVARPARFVFQLP